MMTSTQKLLSPLLILLLFMTACGSDQSATATEDGVRGVSADQGFEIQSNPPADLVVLDVRTPQEFQEGHLEGAMMIDFYEADFKAQLAELDPNVPYLLYCRSGNRSGQTADIMTELGFSNVAEVQGGIISWTEAGLPIVPG